MINLSDRFNRFNNSNAFQSVLGTHRFIEYVLSVIALSIAGISLVMAQWSFPDDGFTVGREASRTYLAVKDMTYDEPAVAKELQGIVSSNILDVAVRIDVNREREKLRVDLLEWFKKAVQPAAADANHNTVQGLLARMDENHRARILELAIQIGDECIDEFAAIEEAGAGITDSEKAAIIWSVIGKIAPANDANIVYQILKEYADISSRKTDTRLTEKIRRAVMLEVESISQVMSKGEVIVENGQVITQEIARKLRYQGYLEEKFPILQIAVVLLLSFTLPLCLDIPGVEPLKRRPSWMCILFVIITTWCCEAAGTYLVQSGVGILPGVLTAYLCIPGPSAFAVSLAATTSSFLVLMMDLPGSDMLLLLSLSVITSMTGSYLLHRLSSRGQVRQRVLIMAVLVLVLRVAMLAIQGFPPASDWQHFIESPGPFLRDCGLFLVLQCVLCTAATFLMTFVEDYIGVISLFTLQDLSSTMTPLLQLMQKNAPGTYQHCLTMATLAEPVALATGMDANLMRVGAFYHDIGKLRRPRFFVENQGGGFNAHDDMSPSLSALTITSHVRDGLELAKEYGLPSRIRDFILEHHGTTCVRYFYNKAIASGENVNWDDFCYPGPKPQSRETALLMIVDSLEAAVRSLGLDNELMHQKKRAADGSIPHPNEGRGKIIESLKSRIKQVITSKINEGQFDEVDFTLQDLDCIAEALKDAVLSMYHTREVKKIDRKSKSRM